jgi:hypothetical protein
MQHLDRLESDNRPQEKIHSILSTIPARIRLESTAVHELELLLREVINSVQNHPI